MKNNDIEKCINLLNKAENDIFTATEDLESERHNFQIHEKVSNLLSWGSLFVSISALIPSVVYLTMPFTAEGFWYENLTEFLAGLGIFAGGLGMGAVHTIFNDMHKKYEDKLISTEKELRPFNYIKDVIDESRELIDDYQEKQEYSLEYVDGYTDVLEGFSLNNYAKEQEKVKTLVRKK